MTELKPCPFCNSRTPRIHGVMDFYYVICDSCGVETQMIKGYHEAVKTWNTRTIENNFRARAERAEAWAKFFVMLGNEMDEEVADFLGQEEEALVSQLSWRDYVAEWRKEREG